MIDFKSLGYEDITEINPIHFRECLGEFFDSIYPYNKRLYKKEGLVTIELKVGNRHNIVFISGICYYPKGWEKFELCAPKDYIDKLFTQTLNAVKNKIYDEICGQRRFSSGDRAAPSYHNGRRWQFLHSKSTSRILRLVYA